MVLYLVTVVTVVVFLVTVDLTTVTTLKPLYFNGLNGVKWYLVTVVTVQLFFYTKTGRECAATLCLSCSDGKQQKMVTVEPLPYRYHTVTRWILLSVALKIPFRAVSAAGHRTDTAGHRDRRLMWAAGSKYHHRKAGIPTRKSVWSFFPVCWPGTAASAGTLR